MNPEIKARWLAELRSGKWRQCHGVLAEGKYERCALGVLCEVIDADERLGECWRGTGALSPEQQEACGLTPNQCAVVADMNDGHEGGAPSRPFSEIAKYIEENF